VNNVIARQVKATADHGFPHRAPLQTRIVVDESVTTVFVNHSRDGFWEHEPKTETILGFEKSVFTSFTMH